MSKLRRTFKQKFDEKAQAPRIFSGVLGNGFGEVNAGDGKAYVRIAGSVNTAVCSSVPYVNNLPVWVGYTPDFPNTLRVLGQQTTKGSEFIGGVGKHAKQHEWMGSGVGGGTDVLNVHLQQFLPLMVYPYSELQVAIYPGIVWIGTRYLLLADSNSYGKPIPKVVDLTDYTVSPDKEKYLLVGINTAGEIAIIEGDEVNEGALLLTDVPSANNSMIFKLAAVRRYYGQTEIIVNRESLDIVDLRFPIWNASQLSDVYLNNPLTDIGDMLFKSSVSSSYTNVALASEGATAIASSVYQTYTADKAIDENEATYWSSASPVAGKYIIIDFGQERSISRYRLKQYGYTSSWGSSQYKVEKMVTPYSAWEEVLVRNVEADDETIVFENPVTCYRIRFFALVGGSGGGWSIYTIETDELTINDPVSRLPIGEEGQHLVVSSGLPTWADNVPASHTHTESDITDLDHDAEKIGGYDVDLTDLADGDVLVYDETSGDWIPETPAAGITVEEIDGTPSVSGVNTINVTNGTLTNDGGGVITLDFGSAATDGSAIHDNEANEIAVITEKTTPVGADMILIEDSEDGNKKKMVQITNLPSSGGSSESPPSLKIIMNTNFI